jgi:hypothetical protein
MAKSAGKKRIAPVSPSRTSIVLSVAFFWAIALIVGGYHLRASSEISDTLAAVEEDSVSVVYWIETREFTPPPKEFVCFWIETRQYEEPKEYEFTVPLEGEYGRAAFPGDAYAKITKERPNAVVTFQWKLQQPTAWNGLKKPMWTAHGYLPPEVLRRIPPNGRIEEELYTAALRLIVDWQGNPADLSEYLPDADSARKQYRSGKIIAMEAEDQGAWYKKMRAGELPHPAILSEERHALLRDHYPGVVGLDVLFTSPFFSYYKVVYSQGVDKAEEAWATVNVLSDERKKQLEKEGYLIERDALAGWGMVVDTNGKPLDLWKRPIFKPDGHMFYIFPTEIQEAIEDGAIGTPVIQPADAQKGWNVIMRPDSGEHVNVGAMATTSNGIYGLWQRTGRNPAEIYARLAWFAKVRKFTPWIFLCCGVLGTIPLFLKRPIFPFRG